MEAQVQVVFGENAERVKSSGVAGEWIGDDVRGAQVLQYGFENGCGAILDRKASATGCAGELLKDRVARRVLGTIDVDCVKQGIAGYYGVERVARRSFADRIVAIGIEQQKCPASVGNGESVRPLR